jgi:hypothetical protein
MPQEQVVDTSVDDDIMTAEALATTRAQIAELEVYVQRLWTELADLREHGRPIPSRLRTEVRRWGRELWEREKRLIRHSMALVFASVGPDEV